MSGGRDLEQQARKFLNLPELRAAWTSTQTTMFNILVEFGAALRAETPTKHPDLDTIVIAHMKLRRVAKEAVGAMKETLNGATFAKGSTLVRLERVIEGLSGELARAEMPAPRDGLNDAIQCAARDLPERWRIEVVVEKNSGWTNIYDTKDDYLPDRVTGVSPDFNLEEQVRYLTKWAAGEPEPR